MTEEFGRALWNLLAPLHGEIPFGDPLAWSGGIDLADTDAVTGVLPCANLPMIIQCWRCGMGPFNSSTHGEGRCEVTRIPSSDWIQFDVPLKTTKPLPSQLRDVQPTQGQGEVSEGVSEEGAGGVSS